MLQYGNLAMKLHIESRKQVSYVELHRDGKNAIGISVKESTKYGLRPVVKNIKAQSLSHRSHCVAEGDVILSICGQDSKGMTKKDVRRLLKEAQSRIDLKLEYEIREACFNNCGVYHFQRLTLNIKKESGSFGFILRKNESAGSASTEYPIISNIRPGGPADREVSLKDGDRLLQIDGQNLSWLSLGEISDILKCKEEATFTVEYNVRMIEKRLGPRENIEVEIDCPETELGMVLDASTQGTSNIFIKEIRPGSLAHRCGAFDVGDVISLINDIDATLLTASKANDLLQNFKRQSGKLTFMPHMGRVQLQDKIYTIQEKEKKDKCFKELDYLEGLNLDFYHPNNPHSARSSANTVNAKMKLTDSSRICHGLERASTAPRLLNNPLHGEKNRFDGAFYLPIPETDFNYYSFQTKTISMFRDILQNISDLQYFVTYLNDETEKCTMKSSLDKNRNARILNTDSPTISPKRLLQLNAIHTKTKELACDFTMHLINNISSRQREKNLSQNVSDIECANNSDGLTTNNLIHQIVGDLSEIYHKKFIPKRSIDQFTSSLHKVELDCRECYRLCLSASLLSQKILLLIFLIDIHPSARLVVSELTNELFKLKVPCEDCERPLCSVSQIDIPDTITRNRSSVPCNVSKPLHKPNNGQRLNYLNNNSEGTISGRQNVYYNTKNSQVLLNINKEDADFRFTDPEVNFTGRNKNAPETEPGGDYVELRTGYSQLIKEHSAPIKKNFKGPCASMIAKQQFQSYMNRNAENHLKDNANKIGKSKDVIRMSKQTWKSAEAISESKFQQEFGTSCTARPISDITKHAQVLGDFRRIQSTTNLKYENGRDCPPPNSHELCPSRGIEVDFASDAAVGARPKSKRASSESEVEFDTVEVKLTRTGQDFGFNFEFNRLSNLSLKAPIITNIQPASAAHRCGILLEGDRILDVNGYNLVGLNVKELERIKKIVFRNDEILMTVEFDVAVQEVKFGTFDVRIDKTIKPGLEFKEFKKSSPLVVKGIVKGSAAHRSGLLFPGDEILFTNCIRQESYDSFSCTYKRDETVILTVRREPDKGVEENELDTDVELESITHDFRSHFARSFVIYRTLVRTVNGTNTRVLDHELALFRDPIQKDFGFLVGQNPTSGRIYVTGIRPGGPADSSKVIKKHDRILEVNGIIVGRSNKSSVLSLFLQDNERMDLITRRILSDQI